MSARAEEGLDALARSAPVLVYALGAGCGHLTRALNLLRRIQTPGVVLHSAGAWSPVEVPTDVRLVPAEPGTVPHVFSQRSASVGALVVDTFPGGLAHELEDDLLAPVGVRALVRRYIRPGTYEDEAELAARFEVQLVPYEAELCEWEGAVSGVHVGPLVRRLVFDDEEPWDLVVVGDSDRLPAGWRAELPTRTMSVRGPFHGLPRACAYLAVGAGHNLTYELLSAGVPFRAVPEERAWDDQFRRADRLGIGVYRREELRTFLRGVH